GSRGCFPSPKSHALGKRVRGRRSFGRSEIPADGMRPVLTPEPRYLGEGRQGHGEEQRTPARGGQPQRRRPALEGQQERWQCATAAVDTGRWLTVAVGSGGGGERWRWATATVGAAQLARGGPRA